MVRRGEKTQGPVSLAELRQAALKQTISGFVAMHPQETLGKALRSAALQV